MCIVFVVASSIYLLSLCLFIRGSAFSRRLKEREKEKELDNRDRQREKEEFEEIKSKLFHEGHPDAETEVARVSFKEYN